MRKTPLVLLLSSVLVCEPFARAYAGAEPIDNPGETAADLKEASEELLVELRILDANLVRTFVNGESMPVDLTPARTALIALNGVNPQAAALHAARFARYEAVAKELRSLQEAVVARAVGIEAPVRKVGALLADPVLRAERPALDDAGLTRVVGVYQGLLAAPLAVRRTGALPTKLQADALALQTALANGQPPAEIARRSAVLMDGLSQADLASFVGASTYRDAIRVAGDGMARVRGSAGLTAEQVALVEGSRARLDGSLVKLASNIDANIPLAPETPSPWDPVTVTFHAALRELLPGTAQAIWRKLSPDSPQADPATVAVYAAAIGAAAPRFQEDFSRLPTNGAFAFGSGFLDGTYWNRIGHGSREESAVVGGKVERIVDWGQDTPRRLLAEARRANSIPFVPRFLADSPERLVLGSLRLLGLTSAADAQGRTIVPKHFPGGPTDIELTEGRTINIPGRFPELAPYLAPFLVIMPLKPKAMMVIHATYSDWEKRDLRPRWPELASVECGGCAYPASLSPFILRGYLRDGLQFRGLIIADWMDMHSIKNFTADIKPKLTPELQRVYEGSPTALIIVMGVHSGLNWITGIPSQTQRDAVPALWGYYRANAKFKALFDAHVEETARLRGKTDHQVTPANYRAMAERLKKAGLAVPMSGDAARDQAYVAFASALEVLTLSSTDTKTQNWTDVRSRGGVMTLSFRIELLNQLNGTDFPTLAAVRRRIPGADDAEEAWIKALQEDPTFMRAYGSVDWEGPDMRAAFLNYMHSQYPSLASAG